MRCVTCAFAGAFVLLLGMTISTAGGGAQVAKSSVPVVPRTWDEAALAEWATPVAGLNVRPAHLSDDDYYAMRVENLRTYPVYYRAESRKAIGICFSTSALSRLSNPKS